MNQLLQETIGGAKIGDITTTREGEEQMKAELFGFLRGLGIAGTEEVLEVLQGETSVADWTSEGVTAGIGGTRVLSIESPISHPFPQFKLTNRRAQITVSAGEGYGDSPYVTDDFVRNPYVILTIGRKFPKREKREPSTDLEVRLGSNGSYSAPIVGVDPRSPYGGWIQDIASRFPSPTDASHQVA